MSNLIHHIVIATYLKSLVHQVVVNLSLFIIHRSLPRLVIDVILKIIVRMEIDVEFIDDVVEEVFHLFYSRDMRFM